MGGSIKEIENVRQKAVLICNVCQCFITQILRQNRKHGFIHRIQ
jgi:hypothetical protein